MQQHGQSLTLRHRRCGKCVKRLGEGVPGHNCQPDGNTGDGRSIPFPHPVLLFAIDPAITGSALQASSSLPVDMWTIGQSPNGCASPVSLRKDGEMLTFAHIPTGNHNNQEEFIIWISRKGRAGGPPSRLSHPPCGRACSARGRPGSKGGSGIFCLRRVKKSSGPGASAAFDRATAAPRSSNAGSGRRDGFPDRT